MIVQLCQDYSRKIVPNLEVPDIQSVVITGQRLNLKYVYSTPPDEYKLLLSKNGENFVPFTKDISTGKENVLWIAPPLENIYQHYIEIQSNSKIILSGDLRPFYYPSEPSKNLQLITKSKIEFVNAKAYPNSVKGEVVGGVAYQYDCPMLENSPTFYEYEGMERLYAIFNNCINLKRIDLRGISAKMAEMLSIHETTFIRCDLKELEVLAPVEWETFNGGIAYENIFVQLQQLGIKATFKYFEL